MNKNQFKGRWKQLKGKTKALFGRLTGNKIRQMKGKTTAAAGRVQAGAGNFQKKEKKRIR
ncbi:MAG: CsbD family protein [Wenzhouxiangellaceae bacterium]|nr:CsbD family protein [Wenzhouxiangellaceae bacterium]